MKSVGGEVINVMEDKSGADVVVDEQEVVTKVKVANKANNKIKDDEAYVVSFHINSRLFLTNLTSRESIKFS